MKQLSFLNEKFTVDMHVGKYSPNVYILLKYENLTMCYFGVVDSKKVPYYRAEVDKIAEQLNCGSHIYTKIEILERLAYEAGTDLIKYDWTLATAVNYNKGYIK